MGGGPLQAELIQAPRAGRQRAAEVLKQVYGGDQEYFKSVSPRRLSGAERVWLFFKDNQGLTNGNTKLRNELRK